MQMHQALDDAKLAGMIWIEMGDDDFYIDLLFYHLKLRCYKEINRSMDKKYYAHSLDGKPSSDWQPLEEYLKNVAEMAQLFADAFGAGDWGYLA